tara:strand:- start:470 stop:1036 length:567 start_codon:yes stop_codon:yes gene_type:complete
MSMIYKMVFLGETGVGKTSICNRLTNDYFVENQEATIGASFVSHIINDVRLQIWDTAGQERYRSLTPMYYRGADVCVLVYDVSIESTFRRLRDWIKSIYDKGDNPLFVIIGNKIDCTRIISKEQAQMFAETINAFYFETSAKTGENVDECFLQIVKTIRHIPSRASIVETYSIPQPVKLDKKFSTKCC